MSAIGSWLEPGSQWVGGVGPDRLRRGRNGRAHCAQCEPGIRAEPGLLLGRLRPSDAFHLGRSRANRVEAQQN